MGGSCCVGSAQRAPSCNEVQWLFPGVSLFALDPCLLGGQSCWKDASAPVGEMPPPPSGQDASKEATMPLPPRGRDASSPLRPRCSQGSHGAESTVCPCCGKTLQQIHCKPSQGTSRLPRSLVKLAWALGLFVKHTKPDVPWSKKKT